ncbi:MerR family transcriptional regulator [Roseovarius nitratireducens]|uniref:MerR family transcriptional regulator n=1 Tax=Roseovarius nitratireducens TaxID=2044597 RepID=UPI000CE24928|nr:MerR family transcriptional regulator [Roseovarius nitratireducens]
MSTIGEAARRSGVHVETIRYYERSGVVPRPARTASGRRDYAEANIRRLGFIRRCRDMGFPLTDARRLAALTADAHANCPDAQAVAEAHLGALRARMAELRAIEAELAALVENCSRRACPCPVLEKLEEGPDRGP